MSLAREAQWRERLSRVTLDAEKHDRESLKRDLFLVVTDCAYELGLTHALELANMKLQTYNSMLAKYDGIQRNAD